jgi:transcriptional regulator with XRE-family HTH domain
VIIDGPAPMSPYPKAWQEFGERLRAARIAIPMALRKFADEIEQSPIAVSQVEQGDLTLEQNVSAMLLKLNIKPSEYLKARFDSQRKE